MGQSLGLPFDVNKPCDMALDVLRAEFRSKGLTVSKIDDMYRIYRVLVKPRRLVFLSEVSTFASCRRKMIEFGRC